jgi:acyl dehydratase
MSATTKYFADFRLGEKFPTPAKTITDAHFLFFAGLTGDNHPIHYDDEYAKTTIFKKRPRA